MRARRVRRHAHQRGQALPLIGVMLAVLIGAAGLSVDLGHQFSQQRLGQAAVDDAALAAAGQLEVDVAYGVVASPPTLWNDPAVIAAHDYVAANAFPTTWPTAATACFPSGPPGAQFSEAFFDSGYAGACSATPTGFTTEVLVNVPPIAYAGSSNPSYCNGAAQPQGYPNNCIQVVVVQRVTNFLMQVFGFPSQYQTTFATGYAAPSIPTLIKTPTPIAVQLYQQTSVQAVQGACVPSVTLQCFNELVAPARSTLLCSGVGDNCPTVLAGGGAATIIGANGLYAQPASAQLAAMESRGDIVNQDTTLTLCDPSGGKPCATGPPPLPNGTPPVGSAGFMLAPGSKLYCLTTTTSPGAIAQPVCAGLPGSGNVFGNSVAHATPAAYSPNAAPAATNCRAGLVLNGDPITLANVPPVFFDQSGQPTLPDPRCVPPATEPYTIVPGQYQFIVINYGQYQFESGFYDIQSNAPASTIQHTETAPNDWDLRPTDQTAGVWIGQGSNLLRFGALALSAPTACLGGTYVSGSIGGGGYKTSITGNAVAFRFENDASQPNGASLGFVSTSKTNSLTLAGPSLGVMSSSNAVPLFDVENPQGYVHLDGATGQTAFSGLVYQAPGASSGGGGVDIHPGLGPGGTATLTGQVLAYRLALFGAGSGTAVDFSGWWGVGVSAQPGSGASFLGVVGKRGPEQGLLTIPSNALQAGSIAGTETVHLQYDDEAMLNAYDLAITVGKGPKVIFSQGFSSTSFFPSDTSPMFGGAGQATPNPPAPYNGGLYVPGVSYYDKALPAYVAGSGGYRSNTATGANNDLTYTTAAANDFELMGDWTWGYQSNMTVPLGDSLATSAHPRRDAFGADIYYTFPIPSGKTVSISLSVVDGDHCGDFAPVPMTFINITKPGGGTLVSGPPPLVQ